MTSLNLSAGAQLLDALLSAGFSAVFWLFYDLLVTLLGLRGRFASALFHLLFFFAGGVAAFCFIVGKTSLGIPRWYLALGFLAGCGLYYLLLSRPLRWLVRGAKKLVCGLLRPLLWPLRWLGARLRALLQSGREKVYNARNRKRASKQAVDGEEKDGEQPQKPAKKPIQAYAKT